MNELLRSPVDYTLQVYNEIFPPPVPDSKFDKVLDLIKAFSSGTTVGTIGQVLENTIKVYGAISYGKQRIEGVKYVTDAYQCKLKSDVEIKRLELQRDRNNAITLYIDKSFQAEMDKINKEYLLKMHNIDMSHATTIREMDIIAQERLKNIDKKYSYLIRENEAMCALYRIYLKDMYNNGSSPSRIIQEISRNYMKMVEKAIFDQSVNLDYLSGCLGQVERLLDIVGNPDNFFVPFDKFIMQRNQINGDFI